MVNDPISNFLITLKNASLVKKQEVQCPFSGVVLKVAELLKKHALIQEYKVVNIAESKVKKAITVTLLYKNGKTVFEHVKRLSKPGRRYYVSAKNIPWTKNPQGLIILSTSKGILSHRQAVAGRIGGELMAEIW